MFEKEKNEFEETPVRVGKLTQDRFQLSSEAGEVEREDDTHIVPTGMVSKVNIKDVCCTYKCTRLTSPFPP